MFGGNLSIARKLQLAHATTLSPFAQQIANGFCATSSL
jgi:hypothetical protein